MMALMMAGGGSAPSLQPAPARMQCEQYGRAFSSLLRAAGRALAVFRYPRIPAASFGEQLAVVHLQWFAAEDEGRTEEPTPLKIRKAREDGKVAKSQDITSSLLLLFTVITLAIVGRFMLLSMMEMISFFFRNIGELDVTVDRRVDRHFYRFFSRLVLPIGLTAFIGGLFGNFVQVGPLFATKPIVPDFNRIAPRFGRYFQRTLVSAEAGFNLLKAVVKLIIIGLIGYLNVRLRFEIFANLLRVPLVQAALFVVEVAFAILLQTAIAFVLLSFFDYLFQRRQHHESLKMTRQEVREERKTSEGDPLVRSRLRQRLREQLSSTMVRNVPRADVVITNPTHYAVAMEYRREAMKAPIVIAKGQDNMAQRIRAVAEEHGVPIIENKPLTRAIYAEIDIGEEVPEKFYDAVVAVLKQVYRLNREQEAV